jgi:hypothetical protein
LGQLQAEAEAIEKAIDKAFASVPFEVNININQPNPMNHLSFFMYHTVTASIRFAIDHTVTDWFHFCPILVTFWFRFAIYHAVNVWFRFAIYHAVTVWSRFSHLIISLFS